MFLGGHGDLSLISNMTRVKAGFSGCVRRLQVNSKLFDMRKARHVGDALYGVDVGKTVAVVTVAWFTVHHRTGVSRLLVLECEMTFHPGFGGRDSPSIPLDDL